MSEDCLGARFEILLDGKTQRCQDHNEYRHGSGEHHPAPEFQRRRKVSNVGDLDLLAAHHDGAAGGLPQSILRPSKKRTCASSTT